MNINDKEINKGEGELPDKEDEQLKDKNQEEITKVTSVLEFLKWVEKQEGTELLFRGQSCCKYEVKSGAKRLFGSDTSYSNSERSHNRDIIENARLQGIYDNSNSMTAKTDWGILAQQQHIGAATSLLDFSSNPLVSLFFACQICPKKYNYECIPNVTKCNNCQKYSAKDVCECIPDITKCDNCQKHSTKEVCECIPDITKCDNCQKYSTKEVCECIPDITKCDNCQKYPAKEVCKCNQQGGEVYSIAVNHPDKFDEFDSLNKLEQYEVEDSINGYRSIYWKPAHINNRIIAQHSYFIIGGQFNNLKKCFIPEENKEDILVDLYRFYDINRITLFPDEAGLAEAKSKNPKYSVVYLEYLNAGLKFHRKRQYEQAIERYTKIIDNKKYKDYYRMQAYNHRGFARVSWGSEIAKFGEIQKTIKQYNAGIKDFNGTVELNRTINITTSIDNMHQITKILSQSYFNLGLTNMQLATYYENQGDDKVHKNLLKKAISHLDNALFNNKKYAEAYSARGSAWAELWCYEKAFTDVNTAIDMDSDSYEVYLDRANIRFIQIRRHESENTNNIEQLQKNCRDAINDCDKVIMIDHNCYKAYIYRGVCNAFLAKPKEIIQKDFVRAFKIMPGVVDTNLIYGFALSTLANNLERESDIMDRNKHEKIIEVYNECLSNLEIFGKKYTNNKAVQENILNVKNKIIELKNN